MTAQKFCESSGFRVRTRAWTLGFGILSKTAPVESTSCLASLRLSHQEHHQSREPPPQTQQSLVYMCRYVLMKLSPRACLRLSSILTHDVKTCATYDKLPHTHTDTYIYIYIHIYISIDLGPHKYYSPSAWRLAVNVGLARRCRGSQLQGYGRESLGFSGFERNYVISKGNRYITPAHSTTSPPKPKQAAQHYQKPEQRFDS